MFDPIRVPRDVMVTKVAHGRLVKVGTVNHSITVWHNTCSVASISVSARIDDVNMNGRTCFDGAALISAYVAKTYHSRSRCAGATRLCTHLYYQDVPENTVLSACIQVSIRVLGVYSNGDLC